MNLPPMIMRIKISQQNGRVSLWLPLFIIMPFLTIILLALFIVLLPLILVGTFILWRLNWWRPLFLFFPVVMGCLLASRGLEVDITEGRETVFIAIK